MKKFLITVIAILGLIQLIPVSHTNPTADKALEVKLPDEAMTIAKRACYDCHSNEVKYPWYSNVAPVSWWIASHVNEGRKALNFSEFSKLTKEMQVLRTRRSAQTLANGRMPLPSYLYNHPEAKLTDTEKQTLEGGFNALLKEVNNEKMTFRCEEGLWFGIQMQGNDATVELQGREPTQISYVRTTIGVRYQGLDVVFAQKGEKEAYLILGDKEYNKCHKVELSEEQK